MVPRFGRPVASLGPAVARLRTSISRLGRFVVPSGALILELGGSTIIARVMALGPIVVHPAILPETTRQSEKGPTEVDPSLWAGRCARHPGGR